MQTIQFARSLRSTAARLKAREISDFLRPLMTNPSAAQIDDTQRNQLSSLLFESRVGFDRLMESPHTAKLINALQISDLYDPARLGKLVSIYHASPNTQAIRSNADFFSAFSYFYGLLQWLVSFDRACSELLERERVGERPVDEEILQVQLLDYDGGGIEADRMRQFLTILVQLHTDLVRAFNLPAARLKVRFVDSGSDIVIAIQSLKVIIDMLKGLYSELWVKVRYQDFEDFDKKIDSLSNGLTFVSALHDQVKKEAITASEADVLKVRVLSEMVKLIGVGGGVAQDDESIEVVDQRKLLTEKRGLKLLGAGTPKPSDGEK
jgi:hypothetical protein